MGFLHKCDLPYLQPAHLTVFNGRTYNSRIFEKITVKNANIIKLHYIHRKYKLKTSIEFIFEFHI